MAKASPALSSFNAGELSPWMEGRIDVDKYPSGAHALQNFIAMVEGPAIRRSGTRYVAEVKDSTSRTWLRPFQFSVTQAFQIEFGDGYCRFYTNHGYLLQPAVISGWGSGPTYSVGSLVTQGGVTYYCVLGHSNHTPPNATYWYAMPANVYEIPSPYAGADLTSAQGTFAFQIQQSADVLYIAGAGLYPPYTLTRVTNTNWQFAVFAPHDGPFIESNLTATTISPSARTGNITLTASAGVFAATDVGRLMRLQVQNFAIQQWQSGNGFDIGTEVTSNGHTYICTTAGNAGGTPPSHLEGIAWDGGGNGAGQGAAWQYEDSGYGVVQITAFTNSTHVTATVIVDANIGLSAVGLPSSLTSTATRHWRLGAWGNSTEYPRAVAFFKDRLFWAGKVRWWGSVPGLYTSHTGDQFGQVTTDSAMAGILSAQDVNNITWMSEANLLLIGTEGGEFGLGPITSVNPLGQDNVDVIRQSKHRCRAIAPILVNTSVLYVQRSGRKLLAMDYNFYLERYDSTNQTRLAYHMTQTGLCDIAYQAEPFQVIWCTRTDGLLVGYTFDREDNVTGWHRHPVGGNAIVECVSVTPAPDGLRDEVWMIVNRTLNGVTRRFVEFIEKQYEAGDAQSSCFYVDSGETYSGAPQQTITGLDHLNGQSVSVLKDGAVHPDCTVSAGAITLMSPGSVVQAGIRCSAKLVTMRIEAGANVGTSQGKPKRIAQIAVRLVDSLGGVIGMENGRLDQIRNNPAVVNMDQPAPIYSGDARVQMPSDWESDCRIQVQQDDPLPMCVVGLFPNLEGNEPT